MAALEGGGNVVVEKYDAREEESDASMVPETSDSVSQTLGPEDTPSVDNRGKRSKSFASLFQDNRNPAKGMTLHKVEFDAFEVEIGEDDVDEVVQAWGYALVGYVAGGFPGIDALNKLRNAWKVPHTFSLHKSGWLVFKFGNEENRLKVLEGGPYMIYGRPLILKNMQPLFEFGACTATVIPSWVLLPGLPIDLWNNRALDKIGSRVGTPLCTDRMTGLKERISYARVLVEVDIGKDLVAEVPIKLPGGRVRMQSIIYERLPKFCTHCRMMGHVVDNCRRVPKGNSTSQPAATDRMDGQFKVPTSSRVQDEGTSLGNGGSALQEQPGAANGGRTPAVVDAEAASMAQTLPKEAAPVACRRPPLSTHGGTEAKHTQGLIQGESSRAGVRKAGEQPSIPLANSFQALEVDVPAATERLGARVADGAAEGTDKHREGRADGRKRITPLPIQVGPKGKNKGRGGNGNQAPGATAGGSAKGSTHKLTQ